jgi:hypothetical protein
MHDAGFTLTDLLTEVDNQLEQIRQSVPKGRYISVARTNIETGMLYLEKQHRETGTPVPLIFEEKESD